MASITCTIGGTPFAALDSADGRYAVRCNVDSRTYEINRFHPPGASGNIISRGGVTGGKIRVVLRYVGTLAAALANYTTDRAAWENTAVAIVDAEGTSWSECNLDPGSMRIDPDPRGHGNDAKCYFDVSATFTIDGA